MKFVNRFISTIICIITVTCVYAQKPDVDQLLKNAIYETNISRDYPKAIKIAESALVISPDYLDVHLILGRLYMLTQRYDEARNQLQWVIHKDPSQLDALNYLINLESETKNWQQAIHYIDQALKYSDSKGLIFKKAGFLEADKQYRNAYLLLEPLLEKSSQDSSILKTYLSLRMQAAKTAIQLQNWHDARKELTAVLDKNPGNEEALTQLYDIETASKNYDSALSYADQGLKYYPESVNFLFRKTSTLASMNRPFEAYALAKVLTARYPDHLEGRKLLSDLYGISRQNRIGVSYDYTFFDQDGVKPWHYGSIYYIREGKFGSVSGKINAANRGFAGGRGYQFELDSYPKHGKSYSFINVAYSNAIIFPKLRVAYSYFTGLSKSWEGELALRYIHANKLNFISYGGSIGKYLGSYWLNFRPFFTSDQGNTGKSFTFTTRKYLTRENYYTLILGTGSSPDDRSRDLLFSSRYDLNSYRGSLGFQHLLGQTTLIGLLGTVNNQELAPGKWRNEFDFFINLQRKF